MGSSIRLADLAVFANPEDTQFQRSAVADLLQRQSLHFPGAQPVSFARHHLAELQRTDYFLCEKTDGIRCLLYLTQHIDNGGEMIEAQYLIDRKNDYYYIHRDSLHIPTPQDFTTFHTGTLLDGELVRQRLGGGRERIVYLIFDCLAMDGENVTSKPFDRRLARINTLIVRPLRDFAAKYPSDVANQPFQIEAKKMELPYGFEMMFREVLPGLPHGNDGLILTCKTTPYVAGTDKHVLKWKPPEENTVDLRLILGDWPTDEDGDEDWDAKPPMELHVNHGNGRYAWFANLRVTDAEWESMKGMLQRLDGRIIECFRDPAASANENVNVWRPKLEPDGTPRFRDDKNDANHISTVESVLQSIEDAVTQQDLIASGYDVRTAYKAREKERLEKEAEERRRAEERERGRRADAERRRQEAARKAAEEKAAEERAAEEKAAAERPADEQKTDAENPDYDEF